MRVCDAAAVALFRNTGYCRTFSYTNRDASSFAAKISRDGYVDFMVVSLDSLRQCARLVCYLDKECLISGICRRGCSKKTMEV